MEEAGLQKKAGQGIHAKNVGIITAIRGSTIDIECNENLPPINSVIRTGNKMEIVLEVQMQPGAGHVRCIALTPTQGLSRGMKTITSNEPLKVPVGKKHWEIYSMFLEIRLMVTFYQLPWNCAVFINRRHRSYKFPPLPKFLESDFYMIGTIDELKTRSKTLP